MVVGDRSGTWAAYPEELKSSSWSPGLYHDIQDGVEGEGHQGASLGANAVIIRVEPAARTVTVGERFLLSVSADTGGEAVYGIECDLGFDSAYLEAIAITPASGFSRIYESKLLSGTVIYKAGVEPGSDPLTGSVHLYSLTLDALQATAGTTLAFSLIKVGGASGQLPSAGEAGSVVIQMPTATPTPSPTATATPTLTASPTPLPTDTPRPTAVPQTTTFDVIQDTTINAWAPDAENGGAHSLNVRSLGVQRALLAFDLTAGAHSIPSDATVVEARLRLYNTTIDKPPIQIAAYGLKRGWVEHEATWQIAAEQEGAAWGTPGAEDTLSDRDAMAQDRIVISQESWHEWDVTELAQRWAQYPETNHGILLVGEEGASVLYALASREYNGGSHKAQLVLTWRPSDPGASPTATPTATYSHPGVLQGYVFEDSDGDGHPGPDEGVVGGVIRARLDAPSGAQTTCTSDGQGRYRCADLEWGWYWLRLVVVPSGYRAVTEGDLHVPIEPGATPEDVNFQVASAVGTGRIWLPLVLRDA
ncbi:MAG: DNRLRE domain-containing protein [Anaerolineae bacterium]|nr:DNRLRE domain-containing protein [Anaerolineae bacterium]